jgi:putative addiction module killer protein
VYFRQNGQEIILLLCGGNKKTQQRDISRAHEIMKELTNGS